MPTYDYHCAANDRVISVMHKMADSVSTWGEVCTKAGLELGDTSADSPVVKRIGLPLIASRDNLGCDAGPPIENAPANFRGPFVNPHG